MSVKAWRKESSPKPEKTSQPWKRITRKLEWTPTTLRAKKMKRNIKLMFDKFHE